MINAKVKEKYRVLLNAVSVSEDISRDHIHVQHTYGHNNAMLGWSHAPFSEAIAAIKQICPKISDKTIARELSRSIVALFEKYAVGDDADPDADAKMDSILPILEAQAIDDKLTEIITFLENQIKDYSILIPINGIELGINDFVMGDVTIHLTEGDKLLAEINGMSIGDDVKEELQKPFIESGCYFSIEETGDFENAYQTALDKAQLVVDILNLYLATFKSRLNGFEVICLSGHPIHGSRSILGRRYLTIDGKTSADFSATKRYPPGRKYKVNRGVIDEWRKRGLDTIIGLCGQANSKPNTIPSRVQHAVTWYSKGINADKIDEQFVDLVISLESLLVGSDSDDRMATWGSISQRLSERVAFLISNNCDERIKIVADVKKIYSDRSKIVHQGQLPSQTNLFFLNRIVATSITTFVQRPSTSWEEFIGWVERQKYQ